MDRGRYRATLIVAVVFCVPAAAAPLQPHRREGVADYPQSYRQWMELISLHDNMRAEFQSERQPSPEQVANFGKTKPDPTASGLLASIYARSTGQMRFSRRGNAERFDYVENVAALEVGGRGAAPSFKPFETMEDTTEIHGERYYIHSRHP